MKKIFVIFIVLVLLSIMQLSSFAISTAEVNLLKPYYGTYVSNVTHVDIAYDAEAVMAYVIDEKGLSAIVPSYSGIEKNGKAVIQKNISKKFLRGIKSVKKEDAKGTITVVFGDKDHEPVGPPVKFTTKNKVQSMAAILKDLSDENRIKVTYKTNEELISIFEKTNPGQLTSGFTAILENTQKLIDARKLEKAQSSKYEKIVAADSLFFENLKKGNKYRFGEVFFNNFFFDNQKITCKMYNDFKDVYEFTTYTVADMQYALVTEGEEMALSTITIQTNEGAVIIAKRKVDVDNTKEYSFVINDKCVGPRIIQR